MKSFKTKRLLIRPLKPSDAKEYLDTQKDKEAKKNFAFNPKNIRQAKEEMKQSKTGLKWAILFEKKFAGFIALSLTEKPIYRHSATISYGIHKNFRGKGIATEAVKVITDYAFKNLKLVRVSGMTRSYNKASQKVLKRAGYKLEGILHKNKFKDGKYIDDFIWANVR